MKYKRVSYRFAKALFDLAIEQKLVDTIYSDIELIDEVISNNRDFVLLLKSPVIKNDIKIKIFKDIFSSNINILTQNFIILIIKKNREFCLKEICNQFKILYNDYKNRKVAIVTSTVPLTENQNQQIISYLNKIFSSEIILKNNINPNIIGGIIIQIEDRIFDLSIKNKINELKNKLTTNILTN